MELREKLADWRWICERHHGDFFWVKFLLQWAKEWSEIGNVQIDAKLNKVRFYAHQGDLSGTYSNILELQGLL